MLAVRARRAALLAACALPLLVRADPPRVPEAPVLPAVLRLPDALRLVRERGLDLLIADAAVLSAEGDARVASAVANPDVSFSYGRSRGFGSCVDAAGAPAPCGWLPDPLYSVGISDSAAVFDALVGKRSLRKSAARAALEAARASRADAARTVELQAKSQFLAVLLAQEATRFAREVAATSARTLELTQARYDAGAISEAELARIEVAKLGADQAVDGAVQALRDARTGLAFLLGVRGPTPEFAVDAPELARSAAPRGLSGVAAERLLEQARQRRPDLVAARAQEERAGSALALARRQRFPDVTLSVSYAQQGTSNLATTPPTFTAGASLPIPLFYRQAGEILKAEADLSTQQLQAAKLDARVAADVASGVADYGAAEALVQRMEGGLLARAERARDLVEVQYRKGAASLLDYLDAQRTFIATRVEYLQDLSLFWNAVFRVEAAVGEELR